MVYGFGALAVRFSPYSYRTGSTPEVSGTESTARTFSCTGARPTEGCVRVREHRDGPRNPSAMQRFSRYFRRTASTRSYSHVSSLCNTEPKPEINVVLCAINSPTRPSPHMFHDSLSSVFVRDPLVNGRAVLLMWPYIRSQIPTATLEVR